MNRLGTLLADPRRRSIIIGVVALGAIAGALLGVIALGRTGAGPTGAAPSSASVAVASPTPSPTARETGTQRPSRSPSPAASEAAAPTPEPSASASVDPGWQPVAIDGIEFVTAIYERDGRLFASGRDPDGTRKTMSSDDGDTWMPVDFSAEGPAAASTIVEGQSGQVAVSVSYPIGMGMPELEYLYSTDGDTWRTAEPPADCVIAGIVASGAGYLGLGDRCRTEGDFAPSPLYILESPDGRSWTSRRDESMRSGQFATDGDRIVILQYEGDPGIGIVSAWISDDAARTWRRAEVPFPDGFNASNLLRGHDLYVVPGSWSRDGAEPQSGVCVSSDGDQWNCAIFDDPGGQLAGRNWLARQIVVTPTGFASLVEYHNDPFFGGDRSIDMVLATSRDGLQWTFAPVPELTDRIPSGLAWTSKGLYAWGGLNRDITPDAPVPFLVVHEAPLP